MRAMHPREPLKHDRTQTRSSDMFLSRTLMTLILSPAPRNRTRFRRLLFFLDEDKCGVKGDGMQACGDGADDLKGF